MSGVPGDGDWVVAQVARMRDVALNEGYRDGWDDAVEQCARVAEFYGWDSGGTRVIPSTSRDIAAAIRALKDK